MSDWPTPEMIDVAVPFYDRVLKIHPVAAWSIARLQIEDMLRTSFDAAPTVDGWVWCEHRGQFTAYTPVDELRHGGACEDTDGGAVYDCPGPHRTLIVGPEVTP